MTVTNQNQPIIISAGMPRAGSTWLYRNLALHPNASTAVLKEINYFTINFDRGHKWFDSLYSDRPSSVRFDVSPFYYLDPSFEENVKKSNLNTKLIIFLREPNHWVRSLYYQIKSFTLKMPPFSEFIKHHTIQFDNRSTDIRLTEFDFLDRVHKLASAFKDNIMLVNFDLIKKDPLKLLKEIEKFSGLPPYYNESNIISSQINASQAKFTWLSYISTNRHLRTMIHKLPFPGLIRLIQRVLYKEKKHSLSGIAANSEASAKDKYQILSDEQGIDNQFPPVFKGAYFQETDIVYL